MTLKESLKELKFKVLKLSTYNSLNNQLLLKDTIILQKELEVNSLSNKIRKEVNVIYKMIDDMNILSDKYDELVLENGTLNVMNNTQAETIRNIHTDRANILVELDKYKGKRNHKGQFTHKEPKTEKVNETV